MKLPTASDVRVQLELVVSQNSELRYEARLKIISSITPWARFLWRNVHTFRWYFTKGLYVSQSVAVQYAQGRNQILNQIQTTAVQSQRALNIARQQTAAKDRERRILQLTIDEIGHMEGAVNLYKGVGKMSVKRSTAFLVVNVYWAQVLDGTPSDNGTRAQGPGEGVHGWHQ
jgi:hypothetical protein